MVGMCFILYLLCGVMIVYTHMTCYPMETRFCPQLDMFLNYTKCEGYLVDTEYPPFAKKTNDFDIILDISGTQLRSLLSDVTNSTTCSLHNVVFLNLSDNQMTSVDSSSCSVPDVKVLDLSRNSITLIGRNSFSRMTTIKNLYLTGNGINSIEPRSFKDLQNLTDLEVSDNNILGIEVETFNDLTNLKYINLTKNKISFITVGAFDGLKRLQTVDLSNNMITRLDALSFSGAEALQYLNLRNNRMKQTDFEFLSIFDKLGTVDLSQNQFPGLEAKVFSRLNVSNIVLTHTQSLRYILAEAFRSCPLLKTIDLSHNRQLFYIHGNAFLDIVTTLRFLDFSGSAIEYLNLKHLSNHTRVVLNETNIKCDCVNNDILTSSFYTEGVFISDCHLAAANVNDCPPKIVSDIKPSNILSVGERLSFECIAVGNPWPDISWVKKENVGGETVYETITTNYRLDIQVTAITQGGTYGCIARALDMEVSRFFNLQVKNIDIGVFVIARAAKSIIISWNKTHHPRHHVVLHREYEVTLNYHVHKLNEYWKIFKLSDLKPETPYEICIGSALDISDRNCVKSSTTLSDTTAGIHTDFGVVLILVMAALILGACFITVICKCLKKLSRGYRGIYMVHSFSRETFGDLREPVLTYENQYADIDIMEDEDKTEF